MKNYFYNIYVHDTQGNGQSYTTKPTHIKCVLNIFMMTSYISKYIMKYNFSSWAMIDTGTKFTIGSTLYLIQYIQSVPIQTYILYFIPSSTIVQKSKQAQLNRQSSGPKCHPVFKDREKRERKNIIWTMTKVNTPQNNTHVGVAESI